MNNAKKIMKNQGVKTAVSPRKVSNGVELKTKILIILGILAAVGLCGIVLFINLRPRPVLTVTGTDSNGKAVTNTVNYKDVVYDIYTTEAQYNSMEQLYQQFYGSSFWEAENVDSDGRNGASAAKKELMDGLKQREILYIEAQKNNITLTDDEKKKVDEEVSEAVKAMSDSQKKIKGLDEDTIRANVEKRTIAQKYKDKVIADLGIDEAALKAKVSKTDYRQYTLQYYTIPKTEDDGNNGTKALSAEQLAKNKKAIEDVRNKAAKAEDFSKNIITDKNEDNIDDSTKVEYSTHDLIETDTDFLDAKTRKAVKKMKNNEISNVLETDEAFYVIKMVNNNDTKAYDEQCDSVVSEEKESKFNEKYKKDIKPNYTTEVQSYWKGRVTLGGITSGN